LKTFSWQERMCVAISWIVFWILVHNNEPRFHPTLTIRARNCSPLAQ
jgi:hypothetical protein